MHANIFWGRQLINNLWERIARTAAIARMNFLRGIYAEAFDCLLREGTFAREVRVTKMLMDGRMDGYPLRYIYIYIYLTQNEIYMYTLNRDETVGIRFPGVEYLIATREIRETEVGARPTYCARTYRSILVCTQCVRWYPISRVSQFKEINQPSYLFTGLTFVETKSVPTSMKLRWNLIQTLINILIYISVYLSLARIIDYVTIEMTSSSSPLTSRSFRILLLNRTCFLPPLWPLWKLSLFVAFEFSLVWVGFLRRPAK